MTDEIKPTLAKAVRALRKELGLTLADVSARTGIPASTLSKVENGKLSLSYDKLVELSHGLDVDITRLFSATGHHSPPDTAQRMGGNRRSLARAGEGHFLQTGVYDHRYLATDILNKRFDPVHVELRARSMKEFGDFVRHPGEEFAYVLEGEVMFHTEDYAPMLMRQGDSVYFDSTMGHAYLASGDGPSRLLSISTSAGLQLHAESGVLVPASHVMPVDGEAPAGHARSTERKRRAAA